MPVPRTLLAACLVGFAVVTAHADASEDSVRSALLADLSAEVASVRERALDRLSAMEDLSATELAEACRAASPRAKPLFFRLAASRRIHELVPDIAAAAAGGDAPAAEAATRALVALGEKAVAAGRAALEGAADDVLPGAERATRLRHLRALDVQRRVERDVIAKWRRKGGSYRGRFTSLAAYGWEAQPILLAMLLDVPLEDQFIVVPEVGEPNADADQRRQAIEDLATSQRRGYRTFEPLPVTIEPEEMFDLAEQALGDVGDLAVLRDVLVRVHARLVKVDDDAGFRPRAWEEGFAKAIEVILALRGDKRLLRLRRDAVAREVSAWRRRASNWGVDDDSRSHSILAQQLDDLGAVLHQLEDFDRAAERYAEAIAVRKKLTGKIAAFSAYNRACALARGGRTDEALEELQRALDPEIASGNEDFTFEWVSEDGDLAVLHGDPRWTAILKARFGAAPRTPPRPADDGK